MSFSKSFDPDIKLKPITGQTLNITGKDIQLMTQIEDVSAVSKTILGKAVIQNGDKTEFAEILGVDDEFNNVILIDSIMASCFRLICEVIKVIFVLKKVKLCINWHIIHIK